MGGAHAGGKGVIFSELAKENVALVSEAYIYYASVIVPATAVAAAVAGLAR